MLTAWALWAGHETVVAGHQATLNLRRRLARRVDPTPHVCECGAPCLACGAATPTPEWKGPR